MSPSANELLLAQMAAELGIDPVLALAMAQIESNTDPWKTRFEPNWRYPHLVRHFSEKLGITFDTEAVLQSMSWGVLQVMGSVAREHGFEEDLTKLTDPKLGTLFGLMHLKKMLKKYPNEIDAVSAYNQGSPRKVQSGFYANQVYVDKIYGVLLKHRKLQ